MNQLTIRTTNEAEAVLHEAELEGLRRRVTGKVLTPASSGYDEARRIWNAMIDRRPGLIAQCLNTEDVRQAVLLARDRRLVTAVRGGGHNIAGNATCEGGLVIDLSRMKRVEIDVAHRRAHVEPGVTLGEFDAAAQGHGLATPLGVNSTTGVAGLTLGGGFGWLSRSHGLTVDNLLSAEVVTADGRILRASGEENADLFWAIRGGGGNFGVVTSFEFQLHPVGPEVLSGLIVHPFADAREVLRRYREVAKAAPDALTCWVVVRKAPPLPFLPTEVHGQEVVVLAAMYVGELRKGEEAMKDLRAIGRPHADVIGPQRFTEFQSGFDPLLSAGSRNYWKSNNFLDLEDDVLDVVISQAAKLPGPGCELFIAQLGGAVNRVQPDATAYAQRGVNFVLNVHARWDDPAEDAACIQWARETFQASAPHATGGVYVNFMSDDEGARVRAAYGANHLRLAAIKWKYDPQNLFRLNQNIVPVAGV